MAESLYRAQQHSCSNMTIDVVHSLVLELVLEHLIHERSFVGQCQDAWLGCAWFRTLALMQHDKICFYIQLQPVTSSHRELHFASGNFFKNQCVHHVMMH